MHMVYQEARGLGAGLHTLLHPVGSEFRARTPGNLPPRRRSKNGGGTLRCERGARPCATWCGAARAGATVDSLAVAARRDRSGRQVSEKAFLGMVGPAPGVGVLVAWQGGEGREMNDAVGRIFGWSLDWTFNLQGAGWDEIFH